MTSVTLRYRASSYSILYLKNASDLGYTTLACVLEGPQFPTQQERQLPPCHGPENSTSELTPGFKFGCDRGVMHTLGLEVQRLKESCS